MDTGCGYDIIARSKVLAIQSRFKRAKEVINFTGVGGPTSTRSVVPITVEELDCIVEPFVLEQTPAVLTIGGRCMQGEYSFVWLNRSAPFFWNKTASLTISK